VRNVIQGCNLTMEEAVAAVSTRPAQLLGLAGPGVKRPIGVIEPGAMADLVVIDDELRTTRVLHNGTWV
jgi:N-acetylglucosamine-6-phosphate deacetylase